MKSHWIALIALFALAFGSCNTLPAVKRNSSTSPPINNQSQKGATQIPSAQPSENPISPMNTPDFSEIPPPPAVANPFVKLAEEDLADRLKIPIDQINFLKISEIDWQDITQGCTSTPGKILTKGRVTGYRIWLEANGKNYLYQIGLDNTIFLCPD